MDGSASLENCTNGLAANPTTPTLRSQSGGEQSGGLVGRMISSGRVENCVNYSDFWDYRTSPNPGNGVDPLPAPDGSAATSQVNLNSRCGGIVGVMTKGTVTNCRNYGDLNQNSGQYGGIIGAIESNRGTVENCTNYGVVSAVGNSGGVVGRISSCATLRNCRNEGPVAAGLANTIGQYAGGLVGAVSTNQDQQTTIRSSANYGVVRANSTAGGGILGYASNGHNNQVNDGVLVEQCLNYGAVISDHSTAANNYYGGIVGQAMSNLRVKDCYNFGPVGNGTTMSNAGGLVGVLDSAVNSVHFSVNSAPVLTDKGTLIGGCVGQNRGVVLACQNTALNLGDDASLPPALPALLDRYAPPATYGQQYLFLLSGQPALSGINKVGGIVGDNLNDRAKDLALIYSSRPTPGQEDFYGSFRYTKNTLNIALNSSHWNLGIGGIVGMQRGGSVVGAYNTGDFLFTGPVNFNLASSGLIGWMQTSPNGVSNGVLAGAFSLGYTPANPDSPYAGGYMGGVLGYRQADHRDEMGVKDAYYLPQRLKETTVERQTGRWYIGNEPLTTAGTGALDQVQTTDGALTAHFAACYPEMTGLPIQVNLNDDQQLISLAEAFLAQYTYVLDAPHILSVAIQPENSNAYTIQWEGGQGLIDGYQLRFEVYEPDSNDPSQLRLKKTILSGPLAREKERVYAISFPSEDIGCFFKVAVQALGLQDEDGTDITTTSPWGEDENQYLILPPLPAPQIKAEYVGGTTYRFLLDPNTPDATGSWEHYTQEGRPAQDYDNLGKVAQADPAHAEEYRLAYEKYWNGLDYINMYINNNGYKTNYPLTRQEDGRFVLEHTFNLKGNQQVNFNLVFTAMPLLPGSSSYTTPVYTVSPATNLTLAVQQMVQLEPPTFISLEYTGDTDQAAYRVHFKPVDHADGYQVRIVGDDGFVLLDTTVNGSHVGDLSADLTLISEEQLGQPYTITLQSLGSGSYQNSVEQEVHHFTTVPRLPLPALQCQPAADHDDLYQLTWNGTGDHLTFQSSITQTDPQTGAVKDLSPTTATATGLDLDYRENPLEDDTKIGHGFIIDVSVQQQGELGVNLTSAAATAQYTIAARLPQLPKPTGTQESPGSLTWTIQWQNDGLTAANCQGYTIWRVDYSTGAATYQLLGSTEGVDSTSLEHTFGTEDAGQQIGVVVVAQGQPGVNSHSLRSEITTLQMPGLLPAPINLQITPPPSGLPLSNEEFEAAEYTFGWGRPSSGETSVITGYEYQLLTTDGQPVVDPLGQELAGSLPDDNLTQTFQVSAAYAGQTLTARVRSTSTTQLGSAWVEIQLTLPNVQLAAPQNFLWTPNTGTEQPDIAGLLTWDEVSYASGYRVRYQQELPGTDASQPPTVVTEQTTVTETGFTAPAYTTAIWVTALGDATGCYLEAPEAVGWSAAPLEPPVVDPTFTALSQQASLKATVNFPLSWLQSLLRLLVTLGV